MTGIISIETNILTGGNMDKIDKILRYDPIAEAEKITGKGHWSNFSEDDNMLALLMNIQHANRKEDILKSSKDTYFSMSWDYLIDILQKNEFELGTEWSFVDDQWGKINNEKAAIYYREDGVVVYAESYNNGTSVNSGKCYYELELKEDVNKNEVFCLIHTGCWYDENKIENELDIREGLIHELNKAARYGNFIRKWENRNHLWILDYMESKNKISHNDKYEVWNKQYQEITKEHISNCPKELQDIVECSL